MATIDVFDMQKNKVGALELSESVFNADVKEYLIHEAVRVQLTNRRAGTVAVKNRSQVAGGGKKPFKQKGTGQARQGCSRAPQYPGGGVAFGPQQKDYHLSMNKKAHKAAMRSVLSYLLKENKLTVLKSWEISTISTSSFVSVLNAFALRKTLVIIDEQNDILELSARNVKDVKLLKAEGLNVYDMMNYKNVVFTEAAVKRVEGALQP
ncbi:MAG: 50S ribosomal protein L4 [Deltaproteobacteria bacterium]|nr:50S ribosomal protein L4 [Deltaproteobacteria bacterium]